MVGLLALALCSGTAWADTHYVDPGGSDTPPYTSWTTAAHSINDAIGAATGGDTVEVAAATYNEQVSVTKPLTILGAGAATTFVDSGTGNYMAFSIINVDDVTIKGFSITCDAIGQAVWLDSSSNSLIEDNILHDVSSGTGMRLVGNFAGYSGTVVRGNTVHDNLLGITLNTAEGMNATDILIEGNTFYNNTNGIGLESSYGGVAQDITVTGNTFYDQTSVNIFSRVWRWPTWVDPHPWGTFSNVNITCNDISGIKGVKFGLARDPDTGYVEGESDVTDIHVNCNNIVGTTEYSAVNVGLGTLDAEDNWWGQDPPDAGLFIGDVDYDPWMSAGSPTLTLQADDECYAPGETVTVTMRLSGVVGPIVGGQFFLAWDTTKLLFVSADAISPFLDLNEDSGAGTLDYSVYIGPPGTFCGDADVATLVFTAQQAICTEPDLITWPGHDPPTRLSDEFGGAVYPALVDMDVVDDEDPTITCPDDATIECDDDPEALDSPLSAGTIGSGATATMVPGGVELYTPDGGDGSAYVRLDIPGGIALNTIASLSYTAKVTTPGAGGYAPEVVLNIDADGDGLEGTGIAWMHSGHDPASLGYVGTSDHGDNFLSGDNSPPGAGSPDPAFVNRDAIGANYYYWCADDTRSVFGGFWTPFSDVLATWLPLRDIHATDLVYSIDIVVGTSFNFDGMTAIVQSVTLNGTTYDVALATGNATATDNCDPAPVISYSDSTVVGLCPQESVITRTWTAEDHCGNISTCDQIITVEDTTAPTATVASLAFCYPDVASAEAAALAGVSDLDDNCADAGSLTVTASTVGTCSATVTVRVEDECDNYTDYPLSTRIDDEDPTATVASLAFCYPDVTSAEAAALAGVSNLDDNCTDAGSFTVTASTVGTCSATVTVRVEDECGNYTEYPLSTRIDSTAPGITAPGDISRNADAGGCTLTLSVATIGSPTVSDNCSLVGDIDVTWSRSDSASNLDDPFPGGTTTITWTAEDECGNTAQDTQDVTVSAYNELVVDVDLLGLGSFNGTRCISFELWECDPLTGPVQVDDVVSFTSGFGTTATLLVPCDDYNCITARDWLHTLRRTIDPLLTDGSEPVQFVADFTTVNSADLIGGNLNDDFWIDILDFGVYSWQWTWMGSGSTTCSTTYPHADISGDGQVGPGTADFTFISDNFLESHEANCCGVSGFRGGEEGDGPITEISVRELRRLGLGHLTVGDLNEDGWLDEADIVAFMEGARPKPQPQPEEVEEAESVPSLNQTRP